MNAARYRPDIDGLRAIAVVPVILMHMRFDWIAGGFLGVDVFFVISGYLITSILWSELEDGSFQFRRFWTRRVRRILPALSLVVLTICLTADRTVMPAQRGLISRQGLAALFSVANISHWRMSGDYWGPAADDSPFLHTWSLSVEEQFYLFVPLLLALGYRFAKRRVLVLTAIAIAASFGAFVWGSSQAPTATFYLLPFRAWEIAVGSFAGLLPPADSSRRRPVRNAIAAVALAVIVGFMVALPDPSTVSPLFAIPVVAAALLIRYGEQTTAGRLLALPPFVAIGRLSYSLYLWHWPVLYFTHQIEKYRMDVVPPWQPACAIAALSLASWLLVEQPARRRLQSLVPIFCGFLLAVGACLQVAVPPHSEHIIYRRTEWLGKRFCVNPVLDRDEHWESALGDAFVPTRIGQDDAFQRGGIVRVHGAATPSIVILGDSHGAMWSGTVDHIGQKLGATVSLCAMNGIDPWIRFPIEERPGTQYITPRNKYLYDRGRIDAIAAWKPKVVIIAARWMQYSTDRAAPLLDELERHAGRILLLEQPPELRGVTGNLLNHIAFIGLRPQAGQRQYFPEGDLEKHEHGLQVVRELAAGHPKREVVPIDAIYRGPNQTVWVLDDDEVIYIDGDHLTEMGARRSATLLEERIRAALDTSRPTN